MDTPTQPLSYEQVLNLYRQQSDNPAVKGMSLHDFSSKLNELSDSNLFAAGMNDNWLKRASVAVDEGLNATGLPKASGDFFQGLGEMIGPEYGKTARGVGESLPRSLIEGLTTGAAMAAPELSVPLAALAGAGTLSAFSKGYTDTGSPAVGAIHAGVNLLFPEAGNMGQKYLTGWLSKRIGENLASDVGKVSSNPIAERLVDYAGEALGTTALQEMSNQASRLVMHQPLGITPQDLFGDVLGNVAFAPYQMFHVARGPEGGKFESMGHYLRALDEAQQLRARTSYLNTDDAKVPLGPTNVGTGPVQEPGGTIIGQFTPEGTAYIRKSAYENTLFGKPIDTVLAQKRESIPSGTIPLIGAPPEGTTMIGRPIHWEDTIQQVLSGTKRESTKALKLPDEVAGAAEATNTPQIFGPPPLTPEQQAILMAKASAIVEQGVVGSGAEGVHTAAEVANDLVKQTGGEPVTDKVIADKMAAHVDQGTAPEEALRKIQQSVENKVNQEAGNLASEPPTTKARNQQGANERLAALPDPVKNFLGEGIVEADKTASKNKAAVSDVLANERTQAAMNWLEKRPLSEADLAKMTPTEKAAAKNDLVRYLNTQSILSERNAAKVDKQKGIQRGTEQTAVAPVEEKTVELPTPVSTKNLDPFTVEAVAGTEQESQSRQVKAVGDLLTEGDIKPEELKAVGLKGDEIMGRKMMAVIRDIASNATFGQKGPNSKKGFAFTPSPETLKIFGGVKAETVQKFVTANLKEIRGVMENRMARQGVEPSLSSPPGQQAVGDFLKSLRAKGWEKLEPGMEGSFAPAMQRYMMRYYMSKGHDPVSAAQLSQVALKMSLLYKNISRTNVMTLVNDAGRGDFHGAVVNGDNGLLGAVGLNLKSLGEKNWSDSFKQFMTNYVIGHEIWHRVWAADTGVDPVRAQILGAMADGVTAMTPQDRQMVLTAALGHMVPITDLVGNSEEARQLNYVVQHGSSDPKEFMATYMGLLAMGAASPRAGDVANDILFSPKFLSDFAGGFYTDLRDVTEGIISMAKAFGGSEKVPPVVESMHDAFSKLAKTQVEIRQAVAELQRAEQMTPKYFQRMVDTSDRGGVMRIVSDQGQNAEFSGVIKDFFDKAGIRDSMTPYLGKRPNWFEKNMMIPAQLRELYHELGDITNLVFGFRGEANNRITMGMAPFMDVDKSGKPRFTKDSPLLKVRSSPVMEEAMSQILLEQNFQKKAFQQGDLEGLTKYQILAPGQKEVVWDLLTQHRQAMTNMADSITQYHIQSIGDALASVLINKGELRAKDGITLGEQLVPLFMATKDEANGAAAMGPLQAALSGMKPEVAKSLMETFEPLYQKFVSTKETLDAQKEFYSPETRLGQFYVRYTKDGQSYFVGKHDINEAHDYVERLKKDPTVDQGSLKVIDRYDKNRDVNTLYPDMVNVYSDIEKAAYQSAADQIQDPELQKQFLDLYTPGEAVYKEVAARGFGKHFLPRSLAPGREEINMVQGLVAYIEGMGMGMAKSLTKRRSALLLSDADMKSNPQLRQLAKDHVMTVVDPPAREWSKFKSMLFHFYLGGNLSSLLVERTQPLFTLAPELTRQGAGLAGGYKIIGQAMKHLFELSTKGDTSLPKDWEVPGMIKRAQDEQRLDFGVLQEMQGLDTDSTIASLRTASFDSEAITPGQLVAKPIYMYAHMMRGLYLHATSYNAKTAFMSGYLFKKRQGASNEDAYNFAVRITESTMFGGGAASRPIGLFANKGNLTGAVGALYTLRHYGVSMVSDMYRLYKESFSKMPGLSEGDRSNAKKALGQMVATQLFMSGAMGLPMAGATVAILQQMFPNWQLKAQIKETLDGLFNDDQHTGSFMSDMALKGVLSAMTPFDVSGRLGLGDIFGLDPNKGATASAMFGATGSFLSRLVTGVQDASEGQYQEAVRNFLPNSIGGIVKLASDGMKIRDRFGNLIYEPDQVETLGALVGFRPNRLADFRDQQALLKNADDVANRQLRDFHDQLSEVLLKGQPELVRQALLQRQLEDESYDARAGLRAVVEDAQRKMYPAELGSSGVKAALGEKESIAKTFAQNRPVPSEMEMLQQRKVMERQVGVPGAGQVHQKELKKAEIVDYLVRLHPTMTRQHAQVVAERLLGGRAANIGRPELSL